MLIKQDVFLSVDRVKDKSTMGGLYILNVHDKQGQVSFTVSELDNENQFQFETKAQILMWIGQQRKSGEVPAWSFFIKEKQMIEPLKCIMQKIMIETKTRQLN